MVLVFHKTTTFAAATVNNPGVSDVAAVDQLQLDLYAVQSPAPLGLMLLHTVRKHNNDRWFTAKSLYARMLNLPLTMIPNVICYIRNLYFIDQLHSAIVNRIKTTSFNHS